MTKTLASVVEMADRGNWVMFHKDGGYLLTTKKEDELKMRPLMNTMRGARVPIARKGNHFVVEFKTEKKEDEYHVPKEVAAKRWSSSRSMDVDEGKLKLENKYGALTVEEEEAYEEYIGCQPCGGKRSVFAGQGWGM